MESRAAERRAMVEQQLWPRGIRDRRVLEAMASVPRHAFVSPQLSHAAYSDAALAIGEGQTISQPFVVALMAQLLNLVPDDHVLEVGTGSGYAAAVLSRLAARVYTIERRPALAEQAESLLADLGYKNVVVLVGDGTEGWPPHAPYNAITIAAAAPEVPPPVIAQLADDGRLVAPVGTRDDQRLVRLIRRGDQISTEFISDVRFVPLIGKWSWQQ